MTNQIRDIQALSEQYARGQLQGDALDQFEDYLMDHPELLEQINVERMLSQRKTVPLEPEVAQTGGRTPAYALAATLFGAVGLGLFFTSLDADPEFNSVTAEIRLETYRSGSSDLPVIRAGSGTTLLLIDVSPDVADAYAVTLSHSKEGTMRVIEGIKPIDQYVQLTAQSLVPGRYALLAKPVDATKPAVRHEFIVQ